MPTAAGCACATWWKDLAILAVVTGIWFCALLGMRPLSNPDEGRYGEIPREMAVTGDFVTPRLNGVKYFEKPPLVYWISALTFRQFGVSEFTVRLGGGIFSIIGVLLTYGACRAIYGRAAGIWSAIILSTTLMYYIFSQIMLLDMAVAVTISGSLFAFILAMREPRGRKRFGLFMVFYAFMALATLSKGLIGIALPGAVIFLWVLLLNRWRALWPFYPIVGTVVLLAIAAPWHVLAARANPDFLYFYFVHEHWLRFTTRIHGRFEPWWFFLPVLIVGLFPWVFFAGQALRKSLPGGWKSRKDHAEAWFFLIWIVFIVAFFSRSQSKLLPYILPVFPAAAVMLARYVSEIWDGRLLKLGRAGVWGFIAACLLLAAAVGIGPTFLKDQLAGQETLEGYLPLVQILICGSLTLGALGVYLAEIKFLRSRAAIIAVALTCAAFLLTVSFAGGHFEKTSTKRFASILKPVLKAGDRVYSVGTYTQDLPVYLNRLIHVVEYQGELKFGIQSEPELTGTRFLKKEDFAKQWAEPGGAYAVVRKSSYERWFSSMAIPHKIVARSEKFVLVEKTPSQP